MCTVECVTLSSAHDSFTIQQKPTGGTVYTVSTTDKTKTHLYRQQFSGKLGTGVQDAALEIATKALTDQQTAGSTIVQTFAGITSDSFNPSAPAPPSSAR